MSTWTRFQEGDIWKFSWAHYFLHCRVDPS